LARAYFAQAASTRRDVENCLGTGLYGLADFDLCQLGVAQQAYSWGLVRVN
jgi:hypothetical protein